MLCCPHKELRVDFKHEVGKQAGMPDLSNLMCAGPESDCALTARCLCGCKIDQPGAVVHLGASLHRYPRA